VKNKESFSYAIKLLGKKSYSKKELEEKLYKKFDKKEVKNIISRLCFYKYIDDEKLARDILTTSFEKNRGFFYILATLKKREIPEKIISKIKEEFDFEKEFCVAEEFFSKNKKENPSTLILKLKSRGFSDETIQKIIDEYGK